jgi:hypothetical protein
MPQNHALTIFNTSKGPIRVNVGARIPIDAADKIIKAVTVGEAHYSQTFDRQAFETEDRSQPDWIGVGDSGGHYLIGFDGSLNKYELELSGNNVTMLSAIFVTP